MKIELNKFYRTRDGKKVKIICIDRYGPNFPLIEYPIIGLGPCGEFLALTRDGKISQDGMDLVSEWSEPEPLPKVERMKWKAWG